MSTPNECTQAGSFSWNELITKNTSAAADFYGKLFGWKAAPFVPQGMPAGAPAYTIFKTDAEPNGVGGMIQPMHSDAPTHWVPYVVVDNIDTSLAKASELGATTVVPVMTIGEVGRVAVIKDPQGATIGFHELPK